MGSLYGDVMSLMLLAPLATPAVAFLCVRQSGVCVPHSSEQVALGCRTPLGKWTPFVFVTFRRCTVAYLSITSFESSYEAGRTALPYFRSVHTNRVQFPMWPWSYSVVEGCLVFAHTLKHGKTDTD